MDNKSVDIGSPKVKLKPLNRTKVSGCQEVINPAPIHVSTWDWAEPKNPVKLIFPKDKFCHLGREGFVTIACVQVFT